jgi:hypothetical protein
MNRFVAVSLGAVLCLLSASFAAAVDPPVVTLTRVDVAAIQPFYIQKIETEPGKSTNVGSILSLAYIFAVKNPNKEPVMLDEIVFTTAFEGMEVNTAMIYDDSWIPGGKTNEIRVVVTNEAVPTVGALSVVSENVTKLQQLNVKAAEMVKKWWGAVGDFAFPISVTGNALFKDSADKDIKVTFSGNWGTK